jgi:hypothetical protein
MKLLVTIGAVALLMSCAASIIDDPIVVQKELVSFNMAVQSKNYDEALELLVPIERNEIMDTSGEVKEKYLKGMKRLRLTTLKRKKLILVNGKIRGMLNVLEEANLSMVTSDEQRQLRIETKPSSSSKASVSSSSISQVPPVVAPKVVEEVEPTEVAPPKAVEEKVEDLSGFDAPAQVNTEVKMVTEEVPEVIEEVTSPKVVEEVEPTEVTPPKAVEEKVEDLSGFDAPAQVNTEVKMVTEEVPEVIEEVTSPKVVEEVEPTEVTPPKAVEEKVEDLSGFDAPTQVNSEVKTVTEEAPEDLADFK